MPSTQSAAAPGGVTIDPQVWYDLPALRRMGFGTAALRAMRHRGLVVHRSGRKSWVEGSSLIATIRATAVVVK